MLIWVVPPVWERKALGILTIISMLLVAFSVPSSCCAQSWYNLWGRPHKAGKQAIDHAGTQPASIVKEYEIQYLIL
jgi:capsule polysaccharide modification protein KpsS